MIETEPQVKLSWAEKQELIEFLFATIRRVDQDIENLEADKAMLYRLLEEIT